MKKTILLLLLMILLTGCSAEVNLEISADNIYETININANSSENVSKEQIYSYFREYIPAYKTTFLGDTEPDIKKNGVNYYYRTVTELDNGYNFNYSYNFELSKYKDARSIGEGFNSVIVQKDNVEKEILITTDNGGLKYFNYYPELESIKINITSLCEVKDTNAEQQEDGVYTWELNRNSKESIYLLLSTTECDDSVIVENKDISDEENEISKFANDNPVIVGLIAFFIFLIVIVIFMKITKITKE